MSHNYHLDYPMEHEAPVCKTFTAYEQVWSNFITNKWNSTANRYLPPCNKMKVTSDVQMSAHNVPNVSDILKTYNWNLLEFLYLTNEYEEVQNVKTVDLEDLFSQIGGSVGILLGYSILQIPTLILMMNRLILMIWEFFVGRKKDAFVGNKNSKVVSPSRKHIFKNMDNGGMFVSTRNTTVNRYRYGVLLRVMIIHDLLIYK